jgi:CheY-like chemotaxis protein
MGLFAKNWEETVDRRILVVDDEREIREFIVEFLRAEGYDVSLAGSGEEALAKSKQKPFDIVLLDVRMKGMDGIQTYHELKKLNPSMRAVLMTAYYKEREIEGFLHQGVDYYLQKPFDVGQLLDLIKKMVQD